MRKLVQLFMTLTACATAISASAQPSSTYYVKPDGNDANNGRTVATAFATLRRARDAIRAERAQFDIDRYLVLIKGGVYTTSNVVVSKDDAYLKLESQDDPWPSQVEYRSVAGEQPLISGGVNLKNVGTNCGGAPGWCEGGTIPTPNGDARWWTIFIPKTYFNNFNYPSDLYAGNKRMTRARFPNASVDANGNWQQSAFCTVSGLNATKTQFDVVPALPAQFSCPYPGYDLDAKIQVVGAHGWVAPRQYLTSLTQQSGSSRATTGFSLGAMPANNNFLSIANGDRVYFENAVEFMDRQYEWYYQETAYNAQCSPSALSVISILLPTTYNPNTNIDIVMPRVEKLLLVSGVSNTKFIDINWGFTNFVHKPQQDCNGALSNTGWNPFGTGYEWTLACVNTPDFNCREYPIRCAIELLSCADVHFSYNRVGHTSGSGLGIFGGDRVRIEANEVFDIGGSGVFVGRRRIYPAATGCPEGCEDPPRGAIVASNHIHDYGVVYHDCVGIKIHSGLVDTVSGQRTTISNNEVHHGAYSGIQSGWGFQGPWSNGCWPEKRLADGVSVDYNLVHHPLLMLTDGGGIHVVDEVDGVNSVNNSGIRGNCVRDVFAEPWAAGQGYSQRRGVMVDQYSSSWTVYENMVFACSGLAYPYVDLEDLNNPLGCNGLVLNSWPTGASQNIQSENSCDNCGNCAPGSGSSPWALIDPSLNACSPSAGPSATLNQWIKGNYPIIHPLIP